MGRAPGLATFTVALAAVGCGGTETAAPAADGGAGGGAAVEGCVEIRVDESVLPEPSDWSWGAFVPRHPFWRGQGALHVAWMNFRTNKSQVSLIVSSFEPATGEHLGSRVYDVVPAGLEPWYASIQDAAGAPDGSFAIVFFYRDGGAGGKTVLRVALGNVASESLSAVWTPPWSVSEAMTFDVGWDGEAFAVHAVKQQGSEVRLVRLAPDGSVVTPETEVGTITDIGDWYSAFVTDAETGRTWMAT
ncbi:MAG: hypothetical protein HY744_14375, partial [Deltaproteobacteria bacterium]|nr:hypothetical protein [Deltaproteobacteria bacterium]